MSIKIGDIMKKGFTLVELLAVIVIVAVLGIVTVPMAMTTVDEANKSAFTSGVQNVLDAAKTYITRVEETGTLPEEGISITELKNELTNYNYISGMILKEDGSIIVEGLSDGKYCASGTKNDLRVIKGNCNNLDNTPPTVKVFLNKRTSNSITILVNAIDATSGIYGYSYSRDGKTYSEITKNNIYAVEGLSKDETVKIYVRVYNNRYDKTNSEENLAISMTEQMVEYTTLEIEKPTFVISTSESSATTVKLVDIIYPKNMGEYEYTYEIDGKEEIVSGEKVRLTVTKNSIIIARIKTGTEIIENELRIEGLDNDGPEANIVYNENWETNKKVKIEVTYEQTGLPSEPYSYDGGKTWTSSNERVYVTGEVVQNKIQVRDILGNITTKFRINGEEAEEVIIDYIDNEKPNCSLKVIKGTEGTNGWYVSNVEIGFNEINDTAKYCNNGVCEEKSPGSGVKSSNIDITQITENGTTTVKGTVVDEVGNVGTCTLTVQKDDSIPNIKAKEETVSILYQQNKDIKEMFEIGYGISSGNTTCYLIQNNQRNKVVSNNNELSLGINVVECEVVTGAGNKASSRVTIKHIYNANGYCTTGTYQNGTCYVYSSCAYTVNTCSYGCDRSWNSCKSQSTVCQGGYITTTGYGQCSACGADYSRCKTWGGWQAPGGWDRCDSCSGSTTSCCIHVNKGSSKGWYCTEVDCTRSCRSYYYAYCNSCPTQRWSDCATQSSVCNGGWDEYNCSSCYSGNPNECRGGNVSHAEYLRYNCPNGGTLNGTVCQF